MDKRGKYFSALYKPGVIIAITILLIVAAITLGNRSINAVEETMLLEVRHRLLAQARGLGSRVENFFESVSTRLRYLGSVPGARRGDKAMTIRKMERELRRMTTLGIQEFGLLDREGIALYSAGRRRKGVDFSGSDFYRATREMTSDEGYRVSLISPHKDESSPKEVLIALPLFDIPGDERRPRTSGKFGGVVFATLKPGIIGGEFSDSIDYSGEGDAFLIDDEYHVLWSGNGALTGKNLYEQTAGFTGFQQTLEKMRAGNVGMTECVYYALDNSAGRYSGEKEEKFIAFSPLSLGKKTFSIAVWGSKQKLRELIKQASFTLQLMQGFTLVVIAAGFLYALAGSYRLKRVVEKGVEHRTTELNEAHERILTILDSLDALVYVADMQTNNILFANRRLKELFGDAAGEVCWQTLQAGRSDPHEIYTSGKLLSGDGKPADVFTWEFQNTITGRWYDVRDRAVKWLDGSFVRLEIAIDITDRKQAQIALRQFSRKLDESREKERQRIAAELHDSLGQDMMVINMEAQRCIREFEREGVHIDTLKLISSMALRSLDGIREIAYNLRPLQLDQLGLKNALISLINRISKTSGVAISRDIALERGEISPEIEINIYRIVQEGLNNIVKHSFASEGLIRIKSTPDDLSLLVSDDGRGFDKKRDTGHTDSYEGFGLRGMEERVKMVGGRFHIDSGIGEGTRVEIVIPLKGDLRLEI